MKISDMEQFEEKKNESYEWKEIEIMYSDDHWFSPFTFPPAYCNPSKAIMEVRK